MASGSGEMCGRRTTAAAPAAWRCWLGVVLGLGIALSVAVTTASAQSTDQAFSRFIEELWPDAQALGVSRGVFDAAFKGVAPDLALPDLIRPGQTRPAGPGQAEFSKTPLEYLNLAQLAALAAQGRTLAGTHAAALGKIETQLGVEPGIVLAIWGRETAFGSYKLQHSAVRVLATQAWTGRRKDVFRKELLYALKMLEDRFVALPAMKASWAGAMGLTQFMPTEFYQTAIRLDGTGRPDLFNSVPDALASAANQLKQKGWQPGKSWGFEVVLPASQSCLAEGIANGRPLKDWVALGMLRADGKPFPHNHLADQAFILMPGGTHGPAFVAFENFLVLKRYNFADLYALFVGHLADRIGGAGDFRGRWTSPKVLSSRDLEEMQTRLQTAGYAIEKIDGKAGMNTRNQIGVYQKAKGLALDCWPSEAVLRHMRSTALR